MAPDTTVRTVPIFFWRDPLIRHGRGFHERANLMFVGGYTHVPNQDAACWFTKDVLPLIRSRVPDSSCTSWDRIRLQKWPSSPEIG